LSRRVRRCFTAMRISLLHGAESRRFRQAHMDLKPQRQLLCRTNCASGSRDSLLQPLRYSSMMGTCSASRLAEGIRTVAALGRGAGGHALTLDGTVDADATGIAVVVVRARASCSGGNRRGPWLRSARRRCWRGLWHRLGEHRRGKRECEQQPSKLRHNSATPHDPALRPYRTSPNPP